MSMKIEGVLLLNRLLAVLFVCCNRAMDVEDDVEEHSKLLSYER